MLNKIKNISLLLFWFIGVTVLLHAFIPHHHHFDTVYEHHANQTGQNSNQHEDSPLHCHAFNRLLIDSDWAVSNAVSYNNVTAVVAAGLFNIQPDDAGSGRISCLLQDERVLKVALTNNPTRGSPGKS